MSLNKKQSELLENLYEVDGLKSRPKIMQTLQEDYPDERISHGAVAKFLQEKKGKKKVIFKEQVNTDAPILEIDKEQEYSPKFNTKRVEDEVEEEPENDIVKEAKEITILARGYHDINKFIKKDKDNELVTMKSLYKNAKIQELLKLRFSLFIHEMNTLLNDTTNIQNLQQALGVDTLLERIERLEKSVFHQSEKAEKDYWKWYDEEEIEDDDEEDEVTERIEKPKPRLQVPKNVQQETNDFMNAVENSVNKRNIIYV